MKLNWGSVWRHFGGLGGPWAPKTFKNEAQNLPKSSQDGAKMRSGRRKIETIAPKRVLGASWGRLGQFLIDFRGQHGPKLAFKIDSKSIKNQSPNRSQN